jgi:hypothetical protein
MALGNPTHRAVGYTAGASTTTASFTVPAGDVIHVFLAGRKNTTAYSGSDFTISDTGSHTWTKFFNAQTYDAGSNPRVAGQWFWAISNGSTITVTGGHTESLVVTMIAVESYTIGAGMVPSCTNFGSNGNAAGDPSITLGATPASLVMAQFISAAANGVTPPTGFTELIEQTNNGTQEVAYDNTTPWNATVSWTTGNVNAIGIVGEVVEVSSGGGGGITGSLSVTLDAATLAATGALAIAGNASVTLDAATLAATGKLAIAGSLAATLDAATLAATGTLPIVGALSTTLDAATLAATGAQGAASGTGSLSVTLDAATVAATGTLPIRGSAAVTLDQATLAATARLAIAGSASVTLDAATLAATGTLTTSATVGTLAVTLDDCVLDSGRPRQRGDDAGWRRAAATAGLAKRSMYTRLIAEAAEKLRALPPKPKKKAAALEAVAETLDAVAVSDPYLGREMAPAIAAVAKTLNQRAVATFDPAEVAMLLEALAREEAARLKRWRRRRDEAAILSILFAA